MTQTPNVPDMPMCDSSCATGEPGSTRNSSRHHPRPHGDCGGNYRDTVLPGEIGSLRNVDRDQIPTFCHQTPFESLTSGAQRVGEHDDNFAGFLHTQVGEIYVIEPMAVDAAHAGAQLIELASNAEAGGGGQQRQSSDQNPERPTQSFETDGMGDRGSAENGQPDHVGEARRTGILDRPLPEARLDQLEVGESGKAIAATKSQADKQLDGKDRQERPPVDEVRHHCQRTDGRLVDPRCSYVDDIGVPIGIRGSLVDGPTFASPTIF